MDLEDKLVFLLLDNDARKVALKGKLTISQGQNYLEVVRSNIEMLIIWFTQEGPRQGMNIKANPFPSSKLNNFLIFPQN